MNNDLYPNGMQFQISRKKKKEQNGERIERIKGYVGIALALIFALALGLGFGYQQYLKMELMRSGIEYMDKH